MNGGPWVKRYEPKTLNEIEGQERGVAKLKDFVANFSKQRKKALIIYGAVGCGKSAAVKALANDLNCELLEINASDTRNAEAIESIVGNALKQRSFFFKGKIIMLDEIDGISGQEDRGGVSVLAKLIENSAYPIIMVANDPFDKKFSELRTRAELVEFEVLNSLHVFNVLKKIAEKEKIEFEEMALKMLSRRAGGDLRAAINDLESMAGGGKLTKEMIEVLSEREKTESVIQGLTKVFKTTDPLVAIDAFERVDEDREKLILWLDENLPKEYTKPHELAKAYHYLSLADIFGRRIMRRQDWRYLVYINSFLTAGVAVSKDKKYDHFVGYRPTTRILKLWQANMKYQKRKAIAEKVALKTHCSTKKALQDTLPYLKVIFEKNKKEAEKIGNFLDLDKEEVKWLEV
jgi:replication factor C large subunit